MSAKHRPAKANAPRSYSENPEDTNKHSAHIEQLSRILMKLFELERLEKEG